MVYNGSFNSSSSTIGVHIRGRNPDANRKPLSLAHYMRAVDYHARFLELQGNYSVVLCFAQSYYT